jgi:hypothetical protein
VLCLWVFWFGLGGFYDVCFHPHPKSLPLTTRVLRDGEFCASRGGTSFLVPLSFALLVWLVSGFGGEGEGLGVRSSYLCFVQARVKSMLTSPPPKSPSLTTSFFGESRVCGSKRGTSFLFPLLLARLFWLIAAYRGKREGPGEGILSYLLSGQDRSKDFK